MTEWLTGKDLPNWLTLLISSIILPILIHWWKRRTVAKIRGLNISVSGGTMTMNGTTYPCINVKFSNHTGEQVHLSNVRLLNPSSLLGVSPDAERDITTDSHILRFPGSSGSLDELQVTINTNQEVSTCLALRDPLDEAVCNFRPSIIKRFCRLRKYFRLSFTAMVKERRQNVLYRY